MKERKLQVDKMGLAFFSSAIGDKKKGMNKNFDRDNVPKMESYSMIQDVQVQ